MRGFILFITAMMWCMSANAADTPGKEYLSVDVTSPGKLAELLGERANEIDSLVVSGTIDASDFNAMWSASFHGRLSAINLENAKIVDGIVPEYAFYHYDEQFTGTGVKVISLQRIMLGEGVTEIGKGAFMYATKLREVSLPKSLRKLGDISFADCVNLMTSPLVLPEGITEIPGRCFIDCKSLSEVVLPSTVTSIDGLAFFSSRVTKINFPEGTGKNWRVCVLRSLSRGGHPPVNLRDIRRHGTFRFQPPSQKPYASRRHTINP